MDLDPDSRLFIDPGLMFVEQDGPSGIFVGERLETTSRHFHNRAGEAPLCRARAEAAPAAMTHGDARTTKRIVPYPGGVAAESVDTVSDSDFVGYPPGKRVLRRTSEQVRVALTPGGRLIAIGPNIQLVSGGYRNDRDHYLPLTERTRWTRWD